MYEAVAHWQGPKLLDLWIAVMLVLFNRIADSLLTNLNYAHCGKLFGCSCILIFVFYCISMAQSKREIIPILACNCGWHWGKAV